MYIIHIGFSGFPIGNAAVQRIKFNFKSLKLAGFFPLIINKHSINSSPNRKRLSQFEGIPYIYTSRSINRPASFLKRNINKLTGYIGEIILLTKKKKKIHTAILYTDSFSELIYYRLLSWLLHFNLVIQYVEYRSSLDIYKKNIYEKLRHRLFDNYFYLFCDGVIVISEFLKDHTLSRDKNKPYLKMPVVCDFNIEYPAANPFSESPYLMYCGTILYIEVIEFILNIFSALKDKGEYNGKLLMVISGVHQQFWVKLNEKIAHSVHKDDIIVKSNLKYDELMSLYAGAEVLMIPLRSTIQDTARFPHKIGEYTASKRPILSNNLGELKFYFQDYKSAILVEEYTVHSFVEKLSNILNFKDLLTNIGEAGYEVGIKYFDYRAQADELKKFILHL